MSNFVYENQDERQALAEVAGRVLREIKRESAKTWHQLSEVFAEEYPLTQLHPFGPLPECGDKTERGPSYKPAYLRRIAVGTTPMSRVRLLQLVRIANYLGFAGSDCTNFLDSMNGLTLPNGNIDSRLSLVCTMYRKNFSKLESLRKLELQHRSKTIDKAVNALQQAISLDLEHQQEILEYVISKLQFAQEGE